MSKLADRVELWLWRRVVQKRAKLFTYLALLWILGREIKRYNHASTLVELGSVLIVAQLLLFEFLAKYSNSFPL